jgi:hypothetical protein
MPSKNIVILAAAGSGKTTEIVRKALSLKDKKVLITTYTNENLDQIKDIMYEENKALTNNIDILSWYNFILQEGVRPYQNKMGVTGRVSGIAWIKGFLKHKKDSYITNAMDIYRDKVSEFAYECDKKTNGMVIKRLAAIYDYVMIDEFQDLSGYDLKWLELLFESPMNIIMMGDPRQATFSTNNAGKNRQFRRSNIIEWVNQKNKDKILAVIERTDCYRCNQEICDLADSLFPAFPKTKSLNMEKTGHDGVFKIPTNEIAEYISRYRPMILKYNIKSNTLGYPGKNIGLSKGRTFDRVLVFPTQPMLKFLQTKKVEDVGDIHKMYIALTRAKYSVAFIC